MSDDQVLSNSSENERLARYKIEEKPSSLEIKNRISTYVYEDSKKFREFRSSTKYIRFGQECAICMEPIVSAKNAWVTECNHVFHKTCITKHFNANGVHAANTNCCPYCRQDVMYDWIANLWWDHEMDLAYELYKDYIYVQRCAGCKQLMGRTQACSVCKNWRNHGKIISSEHFL